MNQSILMWWLCFFKSSLQNASKKGLKLRVGNEIQEFENNSNSDAQFDTNWADQILTYNRQMLLWLLVIYIIATATVSTFLNIEMASLIFCQLSLNFLSILTLKNCIGLIAYIRENVLRFWLQSVPCLWSFWKLIESTRILKAEHALVLFPTNPTQWSEIFFWKSILFLTFLTFPSKF